MKGKSLVIGLILFTLLVIGGIYFAMTATINKIKEDEQIKDTSAISEYVEMNEGNLIVIELMS